MFLNGYTGLEFFLSFGPESSKKKEKRGTGGQEKGRKETGRRGTRRNGEA
jgi:hypothetical protein